VRRCLREKRYFIGFFARWCTAEFFRRIGILDAVDIEIAYLFSLFQAIPMPIPSRACFIISPPVRNMRGRACVTVSARRSCPHLAKPS
jgi:hypothetical protein